MTYEKWLMIGQQIVSYYIDGGAINDLFQFLLWLTLYSFLQDELVEQSSQGSFFFHGHRDMTIVIGIEEHPSRVCIASFGVGVRQYFWSCPWPKTFAAPMT